MRIFDSMDVRTKIIGLVMLPILALLAVGGWSAWKSWHETSATGYSQQFADLMPSIGDLAHELQKERGNSAGFIGSKGEGRFVERLKQQYTDTDDAIRAYREAVQDADLLGDKENLADDLTKIQTDLAALDRSRSDVKSQRSSVADMARYYTGVINDLLALVQHMAEHTEDGQLRAAIGAYDALLQIKERAGIERAMGATGFGSGEFAPEIYQRFVELIGQEKAYQSVFMTHATPEERRLYREVISGPIIDEVERLSEIAKKSPFTGTTGGVKGTEWFDAMTAKIELLKEVENRLAGEIQSLANAKSSRAQLEFLLLDGGVLLLIVVFACLAFAIANDISRPLTGLTEALADLRPGRDVAWHGLDRQDEIGQLARALKRSAEESTHALRTKIALDCANAPVMVADEHLDIVYVNESVLKVLRAAEADIQRDLPNFSVNNLIGTNIDTFHKNPAHQRGMLAGLNQVHKAEITIGGRDFTFYASPITGTGGERLGTVVEWRDLTEQRLLEGAIDNVIDAAGAGDFSKRIDADSMDGVMARLGHGINQLNTLVETAVGDLSQMLEALAQGDLTKRILADYKGSLATLKDNANRTADRLSEIVDQIQDASSEVGHAATEIATGIGDLSNRTEQAAANLEETASSTEQMSATVKQNADNAKNASQLAETANQTASHGGGVVGDAVSAMSSIEESAQKITDIISVIDEIAFQTNLLALNASVEAARAGEAGKGFAVVAQEVRQLAQRSAQAASDIKSLIQDSNDQVQNGVQLVNQAGDALGEIVGSIARVTDIVRDISGASQEQAMGVQEINNSVASMDEMTQQNSALVEESTAAARALSDQAGKLNNLMSFFKLDCTGKKPANSPVSQQAPRSRPQQKSKPAPVTADAGDGWNEF